MLQIYVPPRELWDEKNSIFVNTQGTVLQLEHSLVAISKWESKWHKPFLTNKKDDKTKEEIFDYIRCMTITQNVNPDIYFCLTNENLEAVNKYIEDTMTATWFNEKNTQKSRGSGEQITSELIYYWMVAYQIPFECQKWHLNRLMTLIRICNIKNQPAKKYSKKDLNARNAKLNAERRKRLGTSG